MKKMYLNGQKILLQDQIICIRNKSFIEILNQSKINSKLIIILLKSLIFLNRNLLIDDDNNIKIADFGISRKLEITNSSLSLTNNRGTIGYISPEMFNNKYTYLTDIWYY